MLTAAWLIMAHRTKKNQTMAGKHQIVEQQGLIREVMFHALNEILHSHHKSCGKRLSLHGEAGHRTPYTIC